MRLLLSEKLSQFGCSLLLSAFLDTEEHGDTEDHRGAAGEFAHKNA